MDHKLNMKQQMMQLEKKLCSAALQQRICNIKIEINHHFSLSSAFVRLHLEFYVPYWASLFRNINNKLKYVWNRATQMIRDLEGKTYEEHLKALGMIASFTTLSQGLSYRGGNSSNLFQKMARN